MKRIIFTIVAAISATALLSGCSDRPWDFVFKDFFVAVKSEAGAEASQVLSTSDNFVVQYPVNLVSSERSEDLVVTFEVVPGNGLKEGVDYSLPAKKTLTFTPHEYLKYIRINYLKHVLDESKDNTLVIKLVSTSDPSIRIGYPGPSNRFSSHTVTKIND
jgi:hypothetical protein